MGGEERKCISRAKSNKQFIPNHLRIPTNQDFPGGPMSKTLHIQCKGPGFNPWSRNYIPHAATKDPAWSREDRRSQVVIRPVSSVQSLSGVWLFAIPWITALQPSLSITNSQSLLKLLPLSWWCHPAISSSIIPFSSCPQSLPASGSFPMSQLFTWDGQSIGVSA